MLFTEYLDHARRTRSEHNTRAITMMGLFGEAGEVVDLIKKIVGHGHPITPELRFKMCRELGDVLWYWATGTDDDVASWDDEGIPDFEETSNQMIVEKPRRSLANLALALRVSIHEIEFTDGRPHAIYAEMLRVLASIAAHFELTLVDVAVANVEKLKQRYVGGFSTEASLARVDVVSEKKWKSVEEAASARAIEDLKEITEAVQKGEASAHLIATLGDTLVRTATIASASGRHDVGTSYVEAFAPLARALGSKAFAIGAQQQKREKEEISTLNRALEIAADIATGGPHRSIDLDPPDRL